MIAEHITMKNTAKSSIGRLVDYLTDKQNKQSRVAEMWARNCVAAIAGEDLITGDETEIAKAEHFGAETLATWIKTNCAERIAAATMWEELHRCRRQNRLCRRER